METAALEKVGPRYLLFDLLWRRPSLEKTLKGVHIPLTVIFEHNVPVSSYQTMDGADEVDRRTGKEVEPAKILHDFTRYVRCDDNHIIATYVSNADDAETVEFFDAVGLGDFLHHRMQRADGFLQLWVESVGKNNSVVQSIWSPYVCVVTKRSNMYRVVDTKRSMYERGVTYDGPVHLSEEVSMAPHVKAQVRDLSRSIAEHISLVVEAQVVRLVLYFKVDMAGNVWLMHCGAMKTSTTRPLTLTPRIYCPAPPKRRFVGIPPPKLEPFQMNFANPKPPGKKKKRPNYAARSMSIRRRSSVGSNLSLSRLGHGWERIRVAIRSGYFTACYVKHIVLQWTSLATYIAYSQQRSFGFSRNVSFPALSTRVVQCLGVEWARHPCVIDYDGSLSYQQGNGTATITSSMLKDCVCNPLTRSCEKFMSVMTFRFVAMLVVDGMRHDRD